LLVGFTPGVIGGLFCVWQVMQALLLGAINRSWRVTGRVSRALAK
jgi:hypothetical protein